MMDAGASVTRLCALGQSLARLAGKAHAASGSSTHAMTIGGTARAKAGCDSVWPAAPIYNTVRR
eukprot:scaffold6798_cov108-Isochrysis_galbana.AAC.10